MTTGRRAPRIANWKALLGIGLSLGLLAFALRGVDARAVLQEIAAADPLLFLASIFVATVLFVIRAWRWRLLLHPVRPGTLFRPRFAATTIGFMANNLLPVRIGEFARAYALARLEPLSVTASFGSIVVERLFDGLTVIVFLFLAMALPGFPEEHVVGGRDLSTTALGLTVVFAAAGALLLAMVLWPGGAVAAFEGLADKVLPRAVRRPLVDALEAFLAGLGVLRQPSLLVRTALWSILLWLVGAFSFWLAFLAFDIHVPFSAAVFLQSLIALAVALPSAPGFFGVYEAGARVGLVGIWGIEVNKALGFAIGLHIGGFIPVTVIGLYYAWKLGLTWREVEYSEEVVEEAVEQALPPRQTEPFRP